MVQKKVKEVKFERRIFLDVNDQKQELPVGGTNDEIEEEKRKAPLASPALQKLSNGESPPPKIGLAQMEGDVSPDN